MTKEILLLLMMMMMFALASSHSLQKRTLDIKEPTSLKPKEEEHLRNARFLFDWMSTGMTSSGYGYGMSNSYWPWNWNQGMGGGGNNNYWNSWNSWYPSNSWYRPSSYGQGLSGQGGLGYGQGLSGQGGLGGFRGWNWPYFNRQQSSMWGYGK